MQPPTRTTRRDIETPVGYILLGGVVTSVALVVVGLAWHWATVGELQFEYPLAGMNLFEFVLADVQQLLAGTVRPRVLINMGLAVLMLTPYVRVLISMLYFALAERNRKYALFTGLVFAVLTYSLFLR
ncbi:MAG: DUF1634 domain-containing protein [Chloroflexi bacterium]|nr:DUF1634 domain-containing protein [Chloroflexota bacterium]MBU1750444.1 DUF1634 domain-containing protein [Chloroflexota bacterium]MBU1878088.1 DUF1634 domain-containing protein [Chloroflexota bacterium]